MKVKFLFLLFAALSVNAFSQTVGFMGDRFFVNAHLGVSPDFDKNVDASIFYFGNFETESISIKWPISADFSYVISNDVSIGAGLTSTNFKTKFFSCYFEDDINSRRFSSEIVYNAKIAHAYLEFHPTLSYSIMGNYFRFGFALASYSNKKYFNSWITENNVDFQSEIPEDIVALKPNQKASSMGLYYEVGSRAPLNKHFLITFGLFGYAFTNSLQTYSDFYYTHFRNSESDSFIEDVGLKKMRFSSLVNMHLGLTFAF